MNAARTGLSALTQSAMALAVSAGFVMACGVRITMMASTESSSWAVLNAMAYLSGSASPNTSTGFPVLDARGSFPLRAAAVL